ncbi:MAG TPA: hypothetical protein DDW76_26310 [Cyanobacteria bacterium UBA11369]|nr:hypothetical protein [Cyanobacteria bacterium UBA11371]HBE32241.1 hypothetical protein [Cyanobacteria bacterium UBA11368]HBE52187.1 hypothetical protein [Cyanobacteria bacterium UBA11369]
MSQSARAVLENAVERALYKRGYVLVGDSLLRKQRLEQLLNSTNRPKRYSKQVEVGTGIYGTDLHVDFYIIGSPLYNKGLIIECKSQQRSGSVDEKLPYLNLNIQLYPAPAIVLIDGTGIKQGAIDWLNEQVKTNQNLLAVHNLSSFFTWANNNL